MTIEKLSNNMKVLYAIKAGHTSKTEIIDALVKLNVEMGTAEQAYRNCISSGYIKRQLHEGITVYKTTSFGNYVFKDTMRKHIDIPTPKTPKPRHGAMTGEFLKAVAKFNRPCTENEIRVNFKHFNFTRTLYNMKRSGYVKEDCSERYSLTPKGMQRLHILDMQLNDTYECMTSTHKCTNAIVAAMKANVTTKPVTAQTVLPTVEVVALSAPKMQESNEVINKLNKLFE